MFGIFRWTKSARKANHRKAQFFRPRVEELEDRTVPSLFGDATNLAVALPASVAVGDFNGDGKPDLAVGKYGAANVALSIFLGDGAGSFSAGTNFAANGVNVAVGDFNGDGRLDIAVAGYQDVSIFLGNGAGGFSPPTNFTVGNSLALDHVAVADFNGDGKLDLAVTNQTNNLVSILLGNGAGGFSAPTNFVAGSWSYSAAVGDFNGDGKLDLAVANFLGDNVSILLGDGAGGFSAPTNFAAGNHPYSVAVGDFNGDGKLDLAVANFLGDNVSILVGDGAGGFSAPTNFATGRSPAWVAVGEFNGDGKPDLAVTNWNGKSVSILLGNGVGGFSAPTNFGVGNQPGFVTVADFNGDGKPDLAVANLFDNNVSILLNQTGGLDLPDINVLSATSKDPAHVTFNYQISNGNITSSFDVAVYRSADAQFDAATDTRVAVQTISGLDDSGKGIGLIGFHTKTIGLQGQMLGIDPSHPYVFVVADPADQIVESNENNNTASFRKYVLGVVTHGLELDGNFPSWVITMANALHDSDNYDKVIAFNWAEQSRLLEPDWTVKEGGILALEIRTSALALMSLPEFDFHPGDVIDIHLIGHSRGTVVISQALQNPLIETIPALKAGYVKMTMLDPHPANNRWNPQYSVALGPVGWLAQAAVRTFETHAADPDVVVPSNVSEAEIFYQHTPAWLTGNSLEAALNLWGEDTVQSPVPLSYYNLTGIGIGHEEVHQWYEDHIVPTLGTGAAFLSPSSTPSFAPAMGSQSVRIQAGALIAIPATHRVSDTELLLLGLVDNRGVANSILQELTTAEASFDRGNSVATISKLRALVHHTQAQRGKHVLAEAADFLTEITLLAIDGIEESAMIAP